MLKPATFLFVYVAFLIFLLPAVSTGQDREGRRTVIVRDSSFEGKTQILIYPQKTSCCRDVWYYYYDKGDIRRTQAGYTGSLLDGRFETFYSSDNLRQQGGFVKGLKQGLWRSWHVNGRVYREERWRKGKLHGPFSEFSTGGTITKQGRYRHDALTGSLKVYQEGKLVSKLTYKRGKLIRQKDYRTDRS